MPIEPTTKRAFAFVDGQNLFHAAKRAFGHGVPNYDVYALSSAICAQQGWNLTEVRFYTGIPDAIENPKWHQFWTAKLAQMGRQAGVKVFSRPLRYKNEQIKLPDGSSSTVLVGQEKGIDVRLALDVLGCAHQRRFDVALIFSQDQDLSEVADELRLLTVQQIRWIKTACAYPFSPTYANKHGINGSDWIKMDRNFYNAHLDPRDYFPKAAPSS